MRELLIQISDEWFWYILTGILLVFLHFVNRSDPDRSRKSAKSEKALIE